ncbi:TetR/AcrR family transcriptional regulator [Massilia niabensis]|uniref:TetR/AcrR family transcriptional regulator n=1 Tax=Massilia niabensis TaxID=544910 RepID=A0ABW0LBI1_9BURK
MKKSERREAILAAALEVFAESGYDRASMSDICARVGYSKATLYNYFASKEALFLDLVGPATQAGLDAVHDTLAAPAPDLNAALEHFARTYLAHSFSPRVALLRRLLVSQAGRPGFEGGHYDLGAARTMALLTRFLRSQMDAGRLREADPARAALHLKSLLEAEWSRRYLFEAPPAPTPEQIERTTASALSVFMAAYGLPGTATLEKE